MKIRDVGRFFVNELGRIFSDGGVMTVFFLAGFAYPLIYSLVYMNGTVDDMPVAVADYSCSQESREFIRKMDASREVEVAYRCSSMQEAEQLMRDRKVKGIVMFPADYGRKLRSEEGQAYVSVYADMSSFMYYKDLAMAANHVMLDEIGTRQDFVPILYEENIPYNRIFSYSIFFLPAALMLVIQQTMFYGVSMLSGTVRENGLSHNDGAVCSVLGRGAAYWAVYMVISVYVAVLVPRLSGLPQNGRFADIMVLMLFYVTACVFFCLTFSQVVRHRETVFVLFLFMSPVCLFLTGFSWPVTGFPAVWNAVSWIFPSTFAARAFINMNTAGASLSMVAGEMAGLTVQIAVYCVLACLARRSVS